MLPHEIDTLSASLSYMLAAYVTEKCPNEPSILKPLLLGLWHGVNVTSCLAVEDGTVRDSTCWKKGNVFRTFDRIQIFVSKVEVMV